MAQWLDDSIQISGSMTRSPDDSIAPAGQRWDWQAELHYYGARFYDPRLASFLTHDPVREHANPYAYVGWNPVSRTDPTGMFFAGLGGELSATSFAMGPRYGADLQAFNFAMLLMMRGVGDGGMNGPGGSGPGSGFGMLSGTASASTLPAQSIGAVATISLVLAVPVLAAAALTVPAGMLAGSLVGAAAGALIGGIATGSIDGALAGAAVLAAVGAIAGAVPVTGLGFVALGIWTGVGSALVTATAQAVTGGLGAIDVNAVVAAGLLGVTTGWIGAAAGVAGGSVWLGASVTGLMDVGYAVMGALAQPSAATPAAAPGSAPAATPAAMWRAGVVFGVNFQTGQVATYSLVPGFGYVGPGMFGEDFH
jgi:RHS repeat-associated protein